MVPEEPDPQRASLAEHLLLELLERLPPEHVPLAVRLDAAEGGDVCLDLFRRPLHDLLGEAIEPARLDAHVELSELVPADDGARVGIEQLRRPVGLCDGLALERHLCDARQVPLSLERAVEVASHVPDLGRERGPHRVVNDAEDLRAAAPGRWRLVVLGPGEHDLYREELVTVHALCFL